MQIILGLIPQVLYIAALGWLTKYALNTSLEDIANTNRNSTDSQNSRDRDHYLRVYFNLWKTLNVKQLAGVATDLFYHTTATTVKLFTRLGIRREMGFTTHEISYSTNAISLQLGKVAWCSQLLPGAYRERLIDETTGRVLREKDYPHSDLLLSLNKNPNRKQGQAQCCFGCGTDLSVDGELFLCPNCGASYTADSYEWVINQISFTSPPGSSMFQTITTYFSQICMVFPLLGILATFLPFLNLLFFILLAFMVLVILGYTAFGRWYYSALKELGRYDPLCSMMRVVDRTKYLLGLFWQCRSSDPAAMHQFMDEAAYQQWRQQDATDTGNHVVDFDIGLACTFHSFKVSEGRQHMRVKMSPTLWVFNEHTRQLKAVKRTISFGIYRNEKTRYEDKLATDAIICSGCGMSVNLTADGKCQYCGTTYDVADHDWKLEFIDKGFFV